MKHAYTLFVAVLAISAVVLLSHIVHLVPLYADSGLRTTAKTALTTVANREGWLLSDIEIRRVTDEGLLVTHRRHIRGNDPETCYVIAFKDASLHPCAEKQS